MRLVHDALKETDTIKRRKILCKLFQGCAATSDFPGHLFIDDLVEMYPDAKVILNVRKGGALDWESSMRSTIAPFMSWKYRVACWWSLPDWWHYQTVVVWEDFVKEKFGVKSFWIADAYGKHNNRVRQIMADHGKELLEWEPTMGWPELCQYLGKEEPEQPLPRTNDRAKMEKVVAWRIAIGVQMWAKKLALVTALAGILWIFA
jgi:hypothetical protein